LPPPRAWVNSSIGQRKGRGRRYQANAGGAHGAIGRNAAVLINVNRNAGTSGEIKVAWRRSTVDPMTDLVAPDVIAAYEEAEKAGLATSGCYKAGVDTWRRAHPDQAPHYASQQAVEVILKAKVSLRVD
jgi:hypothetical protein